MAKEKKVSIKYYLVENSKDQFTIYCRVISNRKSTKFSTSLSLGSKSINEAQEYLENILNNNSHPINNKLNFIESIIKHEKFKKGDKFDVVGLGKRILDYEELLLGYLIIKFYYSLLHDLSDSLSHKDYMEVQSIANGYIKGSLYLELIDKIYSILNENEVDLKNILSVRTINQLYLTGIFLMFENIINKKDDDINHLFGNNRIGYWMINYNGIRTSLRDFIKAENPVLELDKLTKNKFSKLLNALNFDFKNNEQTLFTTMDLLIHEILVGLVNVRKLMAG